MTAGWSRLGDAYGTKKKIAELVMSLTFQLQHGRVNPHVALSLAYDKSQQLRGGDETW
jgi:hypothetical protein